MVKKNKKYSAAIIEKVNGLKESGNSKIDQTYERVSSTRMNVGKSLKNTITKRKFEMNRFVMYLLTSLVPILRLGELSSNPRLCTMNNQL